jgi:hypothetical protein
MVSCVAACGVGPCSRLCARCAGEPGRDWLDSAEAFDSTLGLPGGNRDEELIGERIATLAGHGCWWLAVVWGVQVGHM